MRLQKAAVSADVRTDFPVPNTGIPVDVRAVDAISIREIPH